MKTCTSFQIPSLSIIACFSAQVFDIVVRGVKCYDNVRFRSQTALMSSNVCLLTAPLLPT